jgi:hypothetical protein
VQNKENEQQQVCAYINILCTVELDLKKQKVKAVAVTREGNGGSRDNFKKNIV